jgi:drug/metabolite transporter (DMT)-like permease
MLQYLAPILQLGCGVLIFHEPMPPARLAGFALVWLALIVTGDALRQRGGPGGGRRGPPGGLAGPLTVRQPAGQRTS